MIHHIKVGIDLLHPFEGHDTKFRSNLHLIVLIFSGYRLILLVVSAIAVVIDCAEPVTDQ
jgi:hypothetical protein